MTKLASGEAKKAVMEYWQIDTVLSGSFGLMYLDLPEAEKRRAQAALIDFTAAPFSNEEVSTLFKSIIVKEATPTTIDESTIAVRLQLEGDSGRFHSVNTLLLIKTDEGWRISDQRQGDQPSIRAVLAMTYISSAKGPSDTIPVVLNRIAAEMRKQMSGKSRRSTEP